MSRPVARPIATGIEHRSGPTPAGSREISAGKDSAVAPSVYLTAARLDQIAAELSGDDLRLLGFMAETRIASSRQLVLMYWTQDPAAEPAKARAGLRALKRLCDWRILDPLPGRARGGVGGGSSPLIYAVGVGGVKLLARHGYRLRRMGVPGERFRAHVLACTQIVVDLHVASKRGTLDLIEVQQEPRCHRAFLGPWGARLWVRPDLFTRVGVGALEDRWFIEADLGTEHAGTLAAKAKRYLAHYRSGSEQREHGVYPRVLWAVPDAGRAGEVQRILAGLPGEAAGMFTVCLLDRVVGCLAEEARS